MLCRVQETRIPILPYRLIAVGGDHPDDFLWAAKIADFELALDVFFGRITARCGFAARAHLGNFQGQQILAQAGGFSRRQHQAGIGLMVGDMGTPAYQGYLNDRCVTIAEALVGLLDAWSLLGEERCRLREDARHLVARRDQPVDGSLVQCTLADGVDPIVAGHQASVDEDPAPLADVVGWAEQYRPIWEERFDRLGDYVHRIQAPPRGTDP